MLGAHQFSSPRSICRLVFRLRGDRSGSILVKFAITAPILAIIVGASIDYALAVRQKSWLQQAIDAAAMAAARELSLSDTKRDNVPAIVDGMIAAMLSANRSKGAPPTLITTVRSNPVEVEVRATQRAEQLFGPELGLGIAQVHARSVARVVGKPNICLLALDDSGRGTISVRTTAFLKGNNCSVFSNSTSSSGIIVRHGSTLMAQNVCSAGGVDSSGEISPSPLLDCPSFDDPLAGRSPPPIGSCTHNSLLVRGGARTLGPGVYCGGLAISGGAEVTFTPGDYVIRDAPFQVVGTSSINGDGVSFYLDAGAAIWFGPRTSVRLSASKTGTMAGLLFFGSRTEGRPMRHNILSRNANDVTGTIYLPNGEFVADGDAKIGSVAAYTAIVARKVTLMNGPHIVLNANFEKTDVPVPDGIRGAGQPVQLAE